MQQTIFVSATNTNIGKTYISCALIERLSARGYKVGVFKPIETGVVDVPVDAHTLFETAKLYNPALKALDLQTICPYQFALPAAPYVAKGHEKIEMEVITAALERIKALSDMVIIEGAGGLLVPVEENLMVLDIAQLLADKLLLVVPSRLGSINDTLLNLFRLQHTTLPVVWTVNLFEDTQSFDTITAPFYEAKYPDFTVWQRDNSRVVDALLNDL